MDHAAAIDEPAPRLRSGRAHLVPPLALVLVAFALAGCRGHVEVTVSGDGTGGGTVQVHVELDQEAIEAIGGAESIVLDDLAESSWELSEDSSDRDDGYVIRAEHDYSDAENLQAVLDSLAGPGVFTVQRAQAEEGFATRSSELVVDVAVSGSLEQFSDDALTELLGGLPLGYTAEELAFIGADRPGAATMELIVSVPGGGADSAELDLTSGEAASASVSSRGERTDTAVLAVLAVAAALVLAGAVLLVVSQRRRSLRP